MKPQLEPIAVINTGVALCEVLIALALGFGVPLTKEQTGAVMAVVVAIGNLIKVIWARNQVTPVANPRNNEGQPLVPAPK